MPPEDVYSVKYTSQAPLTAIGSALLECAWALIILTGAPGLHALMRMVCSESFGGVGSIGHPALM